MSRRCASTDYGSIKVRVGTLFYGLIFCYCTAFSLFVTDDHKNILQISVSIFLAPLIFRYLQLIQKEFILSAALVLYCAAVNLINDDYSFFLSLSYLILFISSYLVSLAVCRSGAISVNGTATFFKRVIYAFMLFVFLQVIAKNFSVPIPANLIAVKEGWSHNGLAVEPSHLARIVFFLFSGLIILSWRDYPVVSGMSKAKQGASFGAVMLGSGSLLALILSAIAFLRLRVSSLPIMSLILCLLTLVFFTFQSQSIERLGSIISADSAENLSAADSSAGLRVAPLFIYISDQVAASYALFFGSGFESSSTYFLGRIPGAADLGSAGFIPGFMIAYGLVGTLFFLYVFVGRNFKRGVRLFAIFWLLICGFSAYNSQVFWLGLMVLAVTGELRQKNAANQKTGKTVLL